MIVYEQEYLIGTDEILSVPINSYYMEQAYINVYIDDVLQTITTHYSVEVLEQNALMILKSNVVFVSAPAVNSVIKIQIDIKREILGNWMADSNTWPRIENMMQHLHDAINAQADKVQFIRTVLSKEWKQLSGSGSYTFFKNEDIEVIADSITAPGYKVINQSDVTAKIKHGRSFVFTGAIDETYDELLPGANKQEVINTTYLSSAYFEIHFESRYYGVEIFNYKNTHVFVIVKKYE